MDLRSSRELLVCPLDKGGVRRRFRQFWCPRGPRRGGSSTNVRKKSDRKPSTPTKTATVDSN